MFRFVAAGVCILASAISSSHAQGQLVRIGPYGHVSVRAPFVAVETSRWGGTYVRAPFTSVYTPPRYGGFVDPYPYHGYGYHRHYYPPAPLFYESYRVPVVPVVPVEPYYAAPAHPHIDPPLERSYRPPSASPQQLVPQLRGAAVRLSNSLARRRDDADIWLDYLAPAKIIQAIDQGDAPASLQPLLSHYDGVVANRDLVSIVRADGFAETRRLLGRFVTGPAPGPSIIESSPAERGADALKNVPTLADPVDPAEETPVPPEPRAPDEPEVTSI